MMSAVCFNYVPNAVMDPQAGSYYHNFAMPMRSNQHGSVRRNNNKRLEEALVQAIPRASSGRVSQVSAKLFLRMNGLLKLKQPLFKSCFIFQRIAQLQQQIYFSCQSTQQQSQPPPQPLAR